MTIEILEKRLQVLQEILEKSKQEMSVSKEQVAHFTVQLEQAKNQFHIVSGHVNEVSFLISEEKKLIELPKLEQSIGEKDGEIDKQDKKQSAKK